MLTKCVDCGSYDVEFYETLGANYYCDDCFRTQEWYDTCLDTRFNVSTEEWCSRGYWLEPQD
jgi:hypothetical protein